MGVITETYREGVGWCDVITDIQGGGGVML